MICSRHRLPIDEEGASATMFVLSLFVFLGIAMLAIDGGNLLASRQGQIADTDSAALAVAQSLIDDACTNDDPDDMHDLATQYVQWNDPDEGTESSVVTVELDPTSTIGGCPRSGFVTVDTVRQPPLFFAPIFGLGDSPTGVSTTVVYGQERKPYGLVPIGICVTDGHYANEWRPFYGYRHLGDPYGWQGWADAKADTDLEYATFYPGVTAHPLIATGDGPWSGTPYPVGPNRHVHRATFASPLSGYECGNAPGTFGWLDFDGNGKDDIDHRDDCPGSFSPQNELNCDVGTGYDGPIHLEPPDCRPEHDDDRCLAGPGSNASAADALEARASACSLSTQPDAASCDPLYIVVYGDDVTGTPADPLYRIESIAGVVIRDYKMTAAVKDRYIDFEFVDPPADGEIGSASSSSTAGFGIQQCGVDGFTDNCN